MAVEFQKIVFDRIAMNVREIRVGKRMNQMDFAKFCNISRDQLVRIETGRGNFKFATLLSIANAIQQTLESFIDYRVSTLKIYNRYREKTDETHCRYATRAAGQSEIEIHTLEEFCPLQIECRDQKIDVVTLEGHVQLTGDGAGASRAEAYSVDGFGQFTIRSEGGPGKILILRR